MGPGSVAHRLRVALRPGHETAKYAIFVSRTRRGM